MSIQSKIEPTSSMPGAQRVRVQLIIEEGLEDNQALLESLARLIDPETGEITLTQAVREVSDSHWFFSEPRIYMETIVERQRDVQDSIEQLQAFLTQKHYQVTPGALGVISDEGARRIVDDLKESPPDLLIVLTRPQSSFAEKLAIHAPCPVLLLRKPVTNSSLKTLVCVDGTESSTLAVSKLHTLLPARSLKATLVTVQNPVYVENAVAAPFVNIPAMEEALEENATMLLAINQGILQAEGIEVIESKRLLGTPAWELLEFAKTVDPDLVVVGSHNRNELAARILGSVSYRLVQSDPHNILIVR